MNINKFTQKSIEALTSCEKLAYDYGNQEISQEHFFIQPFNPGGRSDKKIACEDGNPDRADTKSD
jgi:hypothetical protein